MKTGKKKVDESAIELKKIQSEIVKLAAALESDEGDKEQERERQSCERIQDDGRITDWSLGRLGK